MAKAKMTRRGSPDAIAKRRAARSLNRMFDQGVVETSLDGRTLKRKKRLLRELKEGKGGETLKAHEVLAHVTELLGYGENLTSIRKLKPRLPPIPPLSGDTLAVVRDTQRSYGFDPRAWKVLGVDIAAVMEKGEPAANAPAGKTAGRKRAGRAKA